MKHQMIFNLCTGRSVIFVTHEQTQVFSLSIKRSISFVRIFLFDLILFCHLHEGNYSVIFTKHLSKWFRKWKLLQIMSRCCSLQTTLCDTQLPSNTMVFLNPLNASEPNSDSVAFFHFMVIWNVKTNLNAGKLL